MDDSSPGERRQWWYLGAAAAMVLAGLLFYSQTQAFAWDEGFHLLAAQLILAGKRPYLDFCFPQTPLNAYVMAGWMRVFGDSWRATHVLETLGVAGGTFLMADFVRARFPVPSWRFAAAVCTMVAVGLNAQVVFYGTIGQSYGLALFLEVVAFRFAIAAVERGIWASAACGFFAGAAAGATLLTAPVAPVLFLWIALCNRVGNRWVKMAACLAGGAISWLPIAWLYREGPAQTIFNIVLYQLHYRHKWPGATRQDISALTSWINSAQGFSLAVLAAAGLWFLVRDCDWPRERRREIYLSACLAAALCAELATAHPTFERYFMVTAPFIVIPAIAGFYAVGVRLAGPAHPMKAASVFVIILCFGIARAAFDDSDSYSWSDVEKIAAKADQVTPRGASIWADELIYFLTHRPMPDGMEFAYAHEIETMPAAQARMLHIITASELRRRAAAGEFQTVAACYDTDNTDAAKASDLYVHKETVKDCTVFWDFKR
jgi:hypothetical protein